VLFYYVSLLSEFRVVMSVVISAWKRCSVCLFLQLFVGGIMSCLHLFGHDGFQHIYCVEFVLFFWVLFFFFFWSCVPYIASFSGLSIFAPSDVYLNSEGQQFHQYQQSDQSPLILTH